MKVKKKNEVNNKEKIIRRNSVVFKEKSKSSQKSEE